MLLRSLIVFLISATFCHAELPDVWVIVEDTEKPELTQALADLKLEHAQGHYLAPLDPAARAAELQYGKHHLQCGVVAFDDWRRIPAQEVEGLGIAHGFSALGYNTEFGGVCYFPPVGFSHQESTAGQSLLNPFNAKLTDRAAAYKPVISEEKPRFIYLSTGDSLTAKALAKHLPALMTGKNRPQLIVHLHLIKGVANGYHRQAAWHLYGQKLPAHSLSQVKVSWQVHHALFALAGKPMPPTPGRFVFHSSKWPRTESLEKNRHKGSLVIDKTHALVDGLHIYPLGENALPNTSKELDLAENAETHTRLLLAHTRWWQSAHPAIKNLRAHRVPKQGVVSLTALDWHPARTVTSSGKIPAATPVSDQTYLVDILAGLRENKEYRETFPAWSGAWPLLLAEPGRYRITARLLPAVVLTEQQKPLARLAAGTAHIRLGKNKVQTRVHPGATAISVETDADAGLNYVETWFTGQLPLDRELGAFFVTIERVGEKKFKLRAKGTGE